jgi:hypothetical protein
LSVMELQVFKNLVVKLIFIALEEKRRFDMTF